MDWTIHIDTLVHWANQRGYHVELEKNGDDSICHISKLIEINSSNPQKIQVIRLLHECGHALIFDNGSSFNFEKKREYDEGSTFHRVFTVMEEIEAWKRGRDLCKRLKIPVEEKEWEDNMVKALKKYINWASDLKEKIKNDTDENQGSKTRRKSRVTKEGTS